MKMDNATIAVIIAGVALLSNLFPLIFGGGWHLKANLTDIENRLTKAIKDSKMEIEEQQRTSVHNFGETFAALKEHVRQVEFHIRDNYIRKDDFIVHMKSHDDLLRLNFANITSRLERIEAQLDKK